MAEVITRSGKGQALTAADHDANLNELKNHPDGARIAHGKGIKTANTDGTGEDWSWRDLVGTVRDDLSGAPPTIVPYQGGIRQPQFSVGDEEVREFHINHDHVSLSDIFIHAHWSHNSTTVTSGGVTWQFEMMYAKGHNQQPFSTPHIVNVYGDASTIRYQHMIAEGQASAVAGANGLLPTEEIEIDGLLIVACRLLTNTMSGGASPFLHSFDVHYRSTNVGSKNKAPAFNG